MSKPDVKDYQFKCISIENKKLHGSALSLLCSG